MPRLVNLFRGLFPAGSAQTATSYTNERLADAGLVRNIDKLEQVVSETYEEDLLKELRDLARSKKADEDQRLSSILTRAQGLFVALAIFGSIFTFGTNLLTSTTEFSRFTIAPCATVAAYVIIQMVLMTRNILKAIGSTGYPTSGSTDLATFMTTPPVMTMPSAAGFYRSEALLTLRHYRTAALHNNWRFLHLTAALHGLRNIVFAIGVLIGIIFLAAMFRQPKAEPTTPLQNQAQSATSLTFIFTSGPAAHAPAVTPPAHVSLDCGEEAAPVRVGPFLEGEAVLQPNATNADMVLEQFARRQNQRTAVAFLLIGSSDKATLKPGWVRRFGSNAGLARARADWVGQQFVHSGLFSTLSGTPPRVASLITGPTQIGTEVDTGRLALDRQVRVCAMWQ